MTRALSGKGAHVEIRHAFEGLDLKIAGARPNGAAHSIFQLLNHMIRKGLMSSLMTVVGRVMREFNSQFPFRGIRPGEIHLVARCPAEVE